MEATIRTTRRLWRVMDIDDLSRRLAALEGDMRALSERLEGRDGTCAEHARRLVVAETRGDTSRDAVAALAVEVGRLRERMTVIGAGLGLLIALAGVLAGWLR